LEPFDQVNPTGAGTVFALHSMVGMDKLPGCSPVVMV